MLSVEQAVRALRREILAALAADTSLPGGCSLVLVADRISVSLGMRIRPPTDSGGEIGNLVIAAEPAHCIHHLTIEFKLQATPGTPCQPNVQQALPDAAPPAPEHRHFAVLAEVFGAPGFDSAARATVFREALEELSETQRHAVLSSLGSPTLADIEPSLSHARHLIQRLAGSGPAGPKRGPELLRQLADQGPVGELIQLAAERWRTQSEWVAASTPPV